MRYLSSKGKIVYNTNIKKKGCIINLGNRKNPCKCQNKSVNKFQDKNVQKIYNIDILKKGDIYDIRNKNTN